MEPEPIVAVALLTQTQLNWLGAGLKKVYRVNTDTDRFDMLLTALDELDRRQTA